VWTEINKWCWVGELYRKPNSLMANQLVCEGKVLPGEGFASTADVEKPVLGAVGTGR